MDLLHGEPTWPDSCPRTASKHETGNLPVAVTGFVLALMHVRLEPLFASNPSSALRCFKERHLCMHLLQANRDCQSV